MTLSLLVALMVLVAPAARAQVAAHFTGTQMTVDSNLNSPVDVVVDAQGNLFVLDIGDGRVVEEVPSATGYRQVQVANGFNNPSALAIDSSGNLYIADSGNNQVVKETLSGGAYTQSVVATGIVDPKGVAVDASGNVYVSGNSNMVLEETLSGGSYTQTVVLPLPFVPYGIAVDSSGDFYIADPGDNAVFKETPSGGSYAQTAIGSGLNSAMDVFVDASGNVYIADYLNNRVVEETLSGGTYTQTTIPTTGLNGDRGVAVDAEGQVYIADSLNNRVVRFSSSAVQFNPQGIGVPSAVISLTFTFDTAGNLGQQPAVLTEGVPNLDFTDAGTGTCTTNGTTHTYAAGDTCTVDVLFTPRFAGGRAGAVLLYEAAGNPVTTVYIHGEGFGPQVAFAPVTQSTVFDATTSGLNQPFGLAVDGNGVFYIADDGDARVLKETPAGGGSYTQTTIGSGWINPYGVAVDAAGNVYVVDTTLDNVTRETPSASGVYTVTATIAMPFGNSNPTDVAVDASGNLYIVDYRDGKVFKETPSTGGTFTQSVVASGLHLPWGVTVDGHGNVYITDTYNSRVLKEAPALGGGYTQTTVGTGWSWPEGIAVDPGGNVYVTDYAANDLVEVTNAGDQLQIGSGFQHIRDVIRDASGNLYVADGGNNRILKEDMVTPPAFNFASTAVGSSSSPEELTIRNNGTADLTFAPPTTGFNPSITTGFTVDNTATCPQLDSTSTAATLSSGSSCDYPITFSPTAAGPDSGYLLIADNNLNDAGVTQAIPLSGTGTGAAASTQTIVFPQPVTPVAYGAPPIDLGATASSGLAVTYAVTSGPATVSGSTLTYTGVGTVVVTASQSGNASYTAATPVSRTIVVTAAATTTTLTRSASNLTPGQNVTFTATVTAAGIVIPSGTVTFYDGATSLGTGTLNASGMATLSTTSLPVGANSITASYGATTDFNASTSAAQTVTVTPMLAGTTTTLTANPTSISEGATVTLTATVTSSSGTPSGTVAFTVGSTALGTATLSGGVATLQTTALPVGVDTVTASYSGDSTDTASNGSAGVSVTAVTAGFTITSAPSALSTTAGHSIGTTLTVTPVGGMSGPITFSCAGLPKHSQCAFSSSSITLTGDNKPVQVGLTIETNALEDQVQVTPEPGPSPLSPIVPALAFWWPGSLAGLAFGKKRKLGKSNRNWLHLCLLLVATGALAVGLSGCAGGAVGWSPLTPAGSSNVTVVATASSGVTETAPLTFTVSQ